MSTKRQARDRGEKVEIWEEDLWYGLNTLCHVLVLYGGPTQLRVGVSKKEISFFKKFAKLVHEWKHTAYLVKDRQIEFIRLLEKLYVENDKGKITDQELGQRVEYLIFLSGYLPLGRKVPPSAQILKELKAPYTHDVKRKGRGPAEVAKYRASLLFGVSEATIRRYKKSLQVANTSLDWKVMTNNWLMILSILKGLFNLSVQDADRIARQFFPPEED